MKDSIWLVFYLMAVLALSFVHQPAWLAVTLITILILAGRERWLVLRRTTLAVFLFNLTISAGYIVVSLWHEQFSSDYLLLINLRVFVLVFLGFWFINSINVLKAFSFSPTLSFVVTLAVGQIATFSRITRDFRQAFASRNPVKPILPDRMRHTASHATHLMDKSVCAAADTALAMRSRGCFDD